MLMGNICSCLLQGNGASILLNALQDESDRGLICCIGKFFKPLDNIKELLAWQETAQ